MTGFKKRTYRSIGDFLGDIAFLISNRKRIQRIAHEKTVAPAFRERLMLSVTQVNKCRYCTRVHSKLALTEGVPPEQVAAILAGEFKDCPAEEVPALFYAEHWAETEGRPTPEARAKLVEKYGAGVADDIDLVLRVIRNGNYSGNTLDYCLYLLSFGRLANG